jgi:sentrin-specific protease 1
VRRWTLRNGLAPRLRAVRYWVFPIHVDIHWALAVLDTAEGALHYFDSMAPLPPGAPPTQVNASERTLRALVRWYSDETADKLGEGARVDTSRWRVLRHPAGAVPQQDNGFDCGVFMLHFARCVAAGVPWDFGQADMRDLREALTYDILTTGVHGGPPAGPAAAAAAGVKKAPAAGAGAASGQSGRERP